MTLKPTFIHIPKNAGLTVRRGLQAHIKPVTADMYHRKSYYDALIRTAQENGEHEAVEHAPVRAIDARYLRRSFAVVRDPWTRTVSRFLYGVRGMERGRIPEGYLPTKFEEYLEERLFYPSNDYYFHRPVRGWRNQVEYLTVPKRRFKDPDEDLMKNWKEYSSTDYIMTNIIPFENFDYAVKNFLEIDQDQPVKRSNSFHRGNKNPEWSKWDVDYRSIYQGSTRLINIVSEWYSEDIDYFGYSWEQPWAKKNVLCPYTG